MIELGVNIDHVATLRQARRTHEPDPVWAAVEAHLGGADGITVHLREDRRHIQDEDVRRLRELVHIKLNLEMADVNELVAASIKRVEKELADHDLVVDIAPDLPKGGMRPLSQLVDQAVSPRRFIVLLLGGFAGFALVLASLGIYGLISYSVHTRTQEIGIRMALGASSLDVQSSIVLRTVALAGAGMLMGILASSALTRSVSVLLFGLSSGDPLTFLIAAVLLLSIAAFAGYLPARRASRIDPMICLRSE